MLATALTVVAVCSWVAEVVELEPTESSHLAVVAVGMAIAGDSFYLFMGCLREYQE